jgi:glycosyltransferase involved in cell wall biosynthesis
MNGLNGEKYVRAAIESVYAQTFQDWEIIFWDNASTDGRSRVAISGRATRW